MRRIYSALLLLVLSVLFFQCQREVSNIGGPDFPGSIPTPDPITTAIQGNILDETGAPASGVTIQAGSKTAITDSKGFFRINDATIDKKSAVVTATKAGYFKAYRTFGATSGSNHIEIKLLKKTLTGSIDAAAGGDVSLSNASKVALPANGVVNAATGASYTGQVKVYATYIDPTSADINQIVPGSFMADDKDGKRVVLTSYGMLAVELESVTGERLQVKSGASATLTTAIPSAGQASAPTSIALWSVDETTGIWKEEGTATRNGNVYVGQVSHFSFWNCDVSQNAVMLSFTLKLTGGEAFVHTEVRIRRTNTNTNAPAHGRTDSMGQVSGYVPFNEPLILEVLDRCGQPFYTQNIGPFTQNTNLGVITVSNPGSSVVTVTGKLLSCTNTAVANGSILISFGNYVRYVNVEPSGSFRTTFTRCAGSPANFEILGIDRATQQQSSSATSVPVVMPMTNAGDIIACGTSSTQFINYTLDGTNYSLVSPADSITGRTIALQTSGFRTVINGFSLNTTGSLNKISLEFSHPNTAPGTFTGVGISVNSSFASGSNTARPSVTMTTFPALVGQFYEGTIAGQYVDSATGTHTINGTFRVRRNQ
jgi:hypothetical protein